MSDTPRTDAAYFKAGATMYDLAGEMKQLERELNAANAKIKRLENFLMLLEEAGDAMQSEIVYANIPAGERQFLLDAWAKAKEAKP